MSVRVAYQEEYGILNMQIYVMNFISVRVGERLLDHRPNTSLLAVFSQGTQVIKFMPLRILASDFLCVTYKLDVIMLISSLGTSLSSAETLFVGGYQLLSVSNCWWLSGVPCHHLIEIFYYSLQPI